MSKEENRKGGMYYVAPAQIFDDERLEPAELKFYMLLSGLAHGDGYCYAGNSYLAERMHRKERCVQNWLDKLEDLGYIHREITKKGMETDRKIYITHANSNISYKRNGLHGRGAKCMVEGAMDCTVDMQQIAPIVSEEISKDIYIESKDIHIPPAPKGEFLSFGSHVKLKKEAYEELCLNNSKELIDLCITEMNDYLAAHGKKYKDYAAALRNWLKNRKTSTIPSSDTKKGIQSFFDRFKEVYGNHKHITVGYDYVEFDAGGSSPCEHIKIDENGAKERIINKLRKWGLSTKGLD